MGVFFFSSRRRHTRYWRDWSSDVCSSDLGRLPSLPKNIRRLSHPAMRKQSQHREQPQERRGGSPYRQIRPLPLRLESQMPTYLLEGHLQLPAHDESGEDLLRIGVKVGAEEGLGFELFLRIAHQDPTHRYGEQARAVPHGRL